MPIDVSRPHYRTGLILVGLMLGMVCLGSRATGQASADWKGWGEASLAQIETDFSLPDSGLYADEWKRGQTQAGRPAFMWGCGVQLSALAAGARVDPEHNLARMKRFVAGLEVYWTQGDNGKPGYDVLPAPKPADRYYDDNVWVALAMTEVYEDTHDKSYLDKAEAIFAFVLSGEDDRLGGGIYWREKEKTSKNTCSNGPAVVAALRLYQVTTKPVYLETAKRIYAWTNAHLQDKDGLYWDNIKLDGTVEKTKWSYNTALMLRANCLLAAITQEKSYLDEAERIAGAAEARWVHADTGAISDGGAFAHLLSEAFLALYHQDHNAHWLDLVHRALIFVHDKARDGEGRYGDRWDTPVTSKLDKVGLLSQASVARAYLVVSEIAEK